ncbi:DinB family protein [Jeotgalibacillus sp. R-1-5s-1]|uniref:DinB family protein n=1 Tax=Jeotgalibacillus sp. R-1-5s-1 TaxID=2555897 RepID=UPI00106B16E0|nr:DinB family protein [Jeotgalibacillus sp. R-1-5s-1]TFE01929.1 DinB family protein [Jeotgalibacillus sp. R-1-5s-1]
MNKKEWFVHNETYLHWLNQLNTMDKDTFFAPLAEGKWSVAAIVSHLGAWDRYSLEERVPFVKEGASLSRYPDFQAFNQKAWDDAHSGKSREDIIREAVTQREKLIEKAKTFNEEQWNIRFTIGKQEMTFEEYITGFAEHDEHHMKQLSEKSHN